MKRWKMNELDNMNDFEFAAAILLERRNKTSPYSPLGVKLSRAITTLLDESAKIEAAAEQSRRKEEHTI